MALTPGLLRYAKQLAARLESVSEALGAPAGGTERFQLAPLLDRLTLVGCPLAGQPTAEHLAQRPARHRLTTQPAIVLRPGDLSLAHSTAERVPWPTWSPRAAPYARLFAAFLAPE